jgi:23S rRNA (uracil1939-C5)-methyltransferase
MSARRRRKPSGRGRPAPVRPAETVVISTIAQHGDGEGRLADGTRIFVPLTLPGDEIVVQPGGKRGDGVSGTVVERLVTQDRAQPICDVFGTCGGCQLQHVPEEAYRDWKSDAVRTALGRHGIDAQLAPLLQTPVNARRRATLALVMTQDGPVLGFNAAYSDRVIGIDGCPLLAPALAGLWAPLKAFCKVVFTAPMRADIRITQAGAGSLEVVVITDQGLDLRKREAIAAFADTHDLARFCWQAPGSSPEPVVQRRPVTLNIGKAEIEMPVGGFLQPSAEGEAILQKLVLEAAAGAKRVADLYCGIGTFAFVLASAGKHVLAADDNAAQIAALDQAAGRAGLGGHISTQVRDLKSSPFEAAAFVDFDAVIFDPPRAGAKAQAECLADSAARTVIAVSCNPATLARDLRILMDGGYVLESVNPVDQFPMSYHVEAVAVLRRPA